MTDINEIEPFLKFNEWFKQALNDNRIIEPEAMNLATVNKDNLPSNRMVLLKKHDKNGFCFFTNLGSKKAQEIANNPNVALCFYWGIQKRQIRIQGVAKIIDDFQADNYFATRPRNSQIGAWASKQSSEMDKREDFENRLKFFEEKFINQPVTRPNFWSGFCVKPDLFEFWHEGEYRLHHRQIYEKSSHGWKVKILYP